MNRQAEGEAGPGREEDRETTERSSPELLAPGSTWFPAREPLG